MGEKYNKVTIEILNETYTIKGQSDSERIRSVAEYVDKQMRNIARNNLRLSPTKIAVLTALNIADELFRLEKDYQQLLQIVKENK